MMGKATAVYHTILNKDLAHLCDSNVEMMDNTSNNNSKKPQKSLNIAASSKFTQRLQ